MNIAKAYVNMSRTKKNVFIMVCVGLIASIICLPWCFLSFPGLTIGFILGTTIEILNYLLLVYTTNSLAQAANGGVTGGKLGLTILSFVGRLLLWAGGLVLGALSTFYWKNNIVCIWTVFASYLPILVILFVTILKKKPEGVSRGE